MYGRGKIMRKLGLLAALAVGCSCNSMAMAQSADAVVSGKGVSPTSNETSASTADIVVTGYRASLARADQMKRTAGVVMDRSARKISANFRMPILPMRCSV
jgi:hypothetical protein